MFLWEDEMGEIRKVQGERGEHGEARHQDPPMQDKIVEQGECQAGDE